MNDILKKEREKKLQDGSKEHYVYFLENEYAIKVGVARDIKQRICQLQTGSSSIVKFLGCIGPYSYRDVFKVEAILHQEIERDRKHGEWFYKYAVNALIDNIKEGRYPKRLSEYGEVDYYSHIPGHNNSPVEITVLDDEQTTIRKSICRKLDLIDDVNVLQWFENTLNMIIKLGD